MQIVIGAVKTAHLNWKLRLEAVIQGLKKLQASEVVGHHAYEFDQWCDNAGPEIVDHPLYATLGIHHEKVHSTAREIVELSNMERTDEANAKMVQFEDARVALYKVLDVFYVS